MAPRKKPSKPKQSAPATVGSRGKLVAAVVAGVAVLYYAFAFHGGTGTGAAQKQKQRRQKPTHDPRMEVAKDAKSGDWQTALPLFEAIAEDEGVADSVRGEAWFELGVIKRNVAGSPEMKAEGLEAMEKAAKLDSRNFLRCGVGSRSFA